MLVTDEVSESWMSVRLEQLLKAAPMLTTDEVSSVIDCRLVQAVKAPRMSTTDEVSESWMSVRLGQCMKA